MIYCTVLTLSFIYGFWTDILKCFKGDKTRFFYFFFIGASAIKRFARSRIFRVPQDNIEYKAKKTRDVGAYSATP